MTPPCRLRCLVGTGIGVGCALTNGFAPPVTKVHVTNTAKETDAPDTTSAESARRNFTISSCGERPPASGDVGPCLPLSTALRSSRDADLGFRHRGQPRLLHSADGRIFAGKRESRFLVFIVGGQRGLLDDKETLSGNQAVHNRGRLE